MRRAIAPALALGLAMTVPSLASPPPSPVVSDPLIGAGCVGAGTAHTGDVAVRKRSQVATWTIGLDSAIGLATSRDDGRTWIRRAVPFTECTGGPLEYVLDPDLAIGADGTPWLSASGPLTSGAAARAATGDSAGQVMVAVGDADPVTVFPGPSTERGFLETDAKDPRRGWVLSETVRYVLGGTGTAAPRVPVLGGPEGHLVLGRTTDRGRTWTPTTLRTPSPGSGLLALGLVQTGGALVALSSEYDLKDPAALESLTRNPSPRSPVASQTSFDGGATWTPPVVLGVVEQAALVDMDAGAGLVAVATPQYDGSLLVWTSEDAGRSWQQRRAAGGVADRTSGVGVDDDGRVAVLSYAVNATTFTPQLSVSTDRGRTFAAPYPLGAGFDSATVRSDSHVPPAGPYNGADADGRDLLVSFVADDDRDGRTEVRLARIR